MMNVTSYPICSVLTAPNDSKNATNRIGFRVRVEQSCCIIKTVYFAFLRHGETEYEH